jgi:hypothetical protein
MIPTDDELPVLLVLFITAERDGYYGLRWSLAGV